jgi:simple sugar transport system permease protein
MTDVAIPETPAGLLAPVRRAARAIVAPVAAVAVCLALTAVVLAAIPSGRGESHTFGESLAIIGRTTWERVLLPRPPTSDEGYRNWIQTLQTATPLLLTGLAIAVAFRANVLNIGGQGQYVCGAIAATAVGVYATGLRAGVMIPLHLACAAGAGALIAGVAAALERWRRVPVVLSTLLLNFVALEFLRYLLQGPMRATSADGTLLDPQSPELLEAAHLPQFFAGVSGQGVHVGFFIAVAAAVGVSFLLRRTTFGFRLRVVGENPDAGRFAGMNVARVSFATLALSGALAGLAGGVQVAGVVPFVLLRDVGTDGIGFTGIAVALLARLSPIGVVFSAIFFGLLGTAFRALERSPLDVHSAAAQAVQGALVIAVLVISSARWGIARSPKSATVQEPASPDQGTDSKLSPEL